ncbi:protein kinase domain-containing protein [Streptomyces scopuliridis]
MDSDPLTRTGLVVGTPPFMAPEQFRAGEAKGPFTDVFAPGSVLVFAATGHGPFDATDPFVCGDRVTHEEPDLAGLPDEPRELIVPCLSKDPSERPTVGHLLKQTEDSDFDRIKVEGKFRTGTFVDDVFYGSGESAAYAYDFRTGERMWRRELPPASTRSGSGRARTGRSGPVVRRG